MNVKLNIILFPYCSFMDSISNFATCELIVIMGLGTSIACWIVLSLKIKVQITLSCSWWNMILLL